MLVLTRRPGQKVVFPSLGVTIEVLRSRGSMMRLGIDAPADIPVLRDEILSSEASAPESVSMTAGDEASRELRHEWRNKLNSLLLKLDVMQRQHELGLLINPEQSLEEVFSKLGELEQTTNHAMCMDAPPLAASPSVLIVEDQANERELLATCMRLGGIEAATASNGLEAVDWLHKHKLPDLVLLDMRMPELDGPTFLKQIRASSRLKSLRVFAVSGSSRSEFESETLPIDGWFSKPVRVDSLLQAVRTPPAPVLATA